MPSRAFAATATCDPAAQLRVVIAGHVDHGKSTLVGRLMHDTGAFPEGKLEQLRKAAESRGVPFEWANLMDALQSERDQNITIDTAQTWLRTARRSYVLIDTPGHEEFLKNMVTGAAAADAALLLVDAAEGVRENTRRHGFLLGLLGLREVVVVVNKMDLEDYRQHRFHEIEREATRWLTSLGLRPRAVIPVAARLGHNLAKRSPAMPWYGGPTVIEALDALESPARLIGRPLRFPIQDVYRFDERRVLAGRVESGTLRVGDRVVFLPSGKSSTIRSIERWSAPASDEAHEGECVGITLTEQLFVERGAVAAREGLPPSESASLHARLFWLGRRPATPGCRYKMKLATSESEAEVAAIENVIDTSTLAAAGASGSRPSLHRHQVAEVTLRLRKPIAFDPFGAIPGTGRFVLVDGFEVCGVGTVSGDEQRAEAKAAKNGHIAASPLCSILWLTGAADPRRRTIAEALERELTHRGHRFIEVQMDDGLSVAESVDKIIAATTRVELPDTARLPASRARTSD